MKRTLLKLIAVSGMLATMSTTVNAQNTFPASGAAGIGTTTPISSSLLDVTSITKGILIPRMTKAQRDAIAAPATSLLIYQTNNTPGFYYYTGTAWTAIKTTGASKALDNLTAPTAVSQNLLPGTTNAIDLGSSTNQWKNIYASGNVGIGTITPTQKLEVNGTVYSTAGGFKFPDGTTQTTAISAGTFANLGLSNLSATSINQSLKPNTDNSKDLGASSLGWKDIYMKGKIFLGTNAFIKNTGGICIGPMAGNSSTGSYNIFIGNNAGYTNTTGASNVFLGFDVGSSTTTGGGNTFIGDAAGYTNTTGSNNTLIGNGANLGSVSLTNATAIGNGTYVNASNSLILGNNVNVGIGTSLPVFKLDVKGGSINTDSVYRIGGNTVLSVKGTANTFVGSNSGYYNTTGSGNTATGTEALYANTTGTQNLATGFFSLHNNTTGGYNIGVGNYSLNNNNGSYNNATGYQSMYTNISGSYNIANGMQALYSNTAGMRNSSSGAYSMFYNSTGSNNIATGSAALYHNTTGNSNVAVGTAALYNNTVGGNMVAIGDSALFNQTVNALDGYGNTAIGAKSLISNTTGDANTAIGESTMHANTTGGFNTAIGFHTMYENITGYSNTGIGTYALYNNTTGYENTATGLSALNNNWTGSQNTANGHYALYSNTTGINNTAVGNASLYQNNGNNNTAAGWKALGNNYTGAFCSAFGASSGYQSGASYNTFFGTLSGNGTTTGPDNCFVGEESGTTNSTGSSNTCVGNLSNFGAGNLINASAFGFNATVNTSNKIRLGNSAVTVVEGNAVYTVSDGRFKTNIDEEVKGLDFINKLRPVVYNFEAKKFDAFLNKNQTSGNEERTKGIDYTQAEKIRYSGFIAQEVEQAAKQTGYDFNGVHTPLNNDDNYSLAYAEFVVPLVKAVQELDKNADVENSKVEQIEKENQQLKVNNQSQSEKINSLENDIASMRSCIETLCAANELKSTSENSIVNDESSLGQNNPNPFNENTTIGFYIAASSGKAILKIFSMNGEALKSFIISTKGKGQIEIAGSTLSPGVYTYVLIVDDKSVDTKQMVVTK
ncbi:MAG: tail fiber domain-containing protein [Bacteroidia bacterium]